MSRIRQMSICGIRNFDDENQPRIRFSRPLTLILGPNGTGKTTIIESLRFATTGDFPPGSDKGKAFIHDRDPSASRVVRGFVKAEFVSAFGCVYTICRTIECLHTTAISKFKTLDSTLSRREKGSSKPTSITNRCIDVNIEVISAMGVSKAILNYVIFCHQEEFSWPLDDGKKLKERFDEIFDSVKLNKLLESLLKRIKNLEQDAKVLQVQKQSLHNIVAEVEDKEKKHDNTKKRLQEITNEITTIDKDLQSIVERMHKYETMNTKYKTLVAERDKKQLECDVNQQQIKSLQQNIREVFKGTMTELAAKLELYDDNLSKQDSEVSELEKKVQQIASNDVKITNIITQRKITAGTIKQQIQDQEIKIILRNKTLNKVLSAWDIQMPVDPDTSDTEITGLIQEFENKVENLKRTAEVNRQKRNKKEEELQKVIDMLRSERSKIDSEINIKDNDVTATGNEINRIRTEIREIGAAANELNSVETKLGEANKKIDELSASLDIDNIKKQINDESSTRDALEVELSAIDAEIEMLHKHATLQAEMALHKSAQQAKEREVKCFKKKYEDKIKTLLEVDEVPLIKLKDTLDAIQQKYVNYIKNMTHEVQTERQKLVTAETTLTYNEEELRKKLSELRSNKQKISSVCDYKEFDEALLLQSKQVKDLQDKRGIYAHQSAAYKEYMKQLKKQDPCCPLCHRNFDKSYKISTLIKEMEDEIKNQPDTLKHCEADLKVQQKKYDTMLQLKPVVEKITQLEEIEIPILEETLENTKQKLTKQKVIIEEREKLKATSEEDLKESKNLFEDVMLWDRLIDEMHNLREKICNVENLIAKTGATNGRTISEAQANRDVLNTSLKKSREHSQSLQTKLNIFNEKLQHIREERNILFEKQLKIQSNMQTLKRLKEKQTELSSRRVTLVESVQQLRDRLFSEDKKLETAVEQLDVLKKENWKNEEADRKAVIEGGRQLFELNKIQNEVDAFDRSNFSDTLAKLELEIINYEEKINRNTVEKNKLEATVKELKDEINQQETRKRDLSDNLTLRKHQLTLQDLQQQCQNLNEQLENINYNRMMEKCQKYKNHEESLLRKKNIAEGKKEELERTLIQYVTELSKKDYKNARKNYMDKCNDLELQKDVTSNLKKYSRILDNAIIKYHKERMATVNKIMNKLWKAIYIGNDTTSIEIRTNETEGTHTRRSYNYKLVQIKNGKAMDMRGRCSAGQKVLASIIIRLALAETFCKQCGVLALDEPTTNLDEANADSLADALDRIVKLRSRYQKNFQFIVISHDEKFMLRLAHLNNTTGYHELYRKDNGSSSIRFRQLESDRIDPLPHIKIKELSDEENESTNNSLPKKDSRKRILDSTSKNDDNYESPAKKRFGFGSKIPN